MRIYISNLSKYNQGRLHGQWLELPCTEEEIQDTMSHVLCQGEEYAITDSEGAPFAVSEFDNVCDLNIKLEEFDALGEADGRCVAFLLSEGYDFQYSMEHHEDVIWYADENLENVACSLVEDGCFGQVSEGLNNYIDYEAIARDLGLDGYQETKEGVFYYAN